MHKYHNLFHGPTTPSTRNGPSYGTRTSTQAHPSMTAFAGLLGRQSARDWMNLGRLYTQQGSVFAPGGALGGLFSRGPDLFNGPLSPLLKQGLLG